MEVIFIKDLKNQGKKGEIKKVKDGYAENFLIKNGYAVIKTKENVAKLKHEQSKKIAQEEENKKEAILLKEKLSNVILEFQVKTGEGDKVFGSISVKQIKEGLEKQGYSIEKNKIKLETPISSLGFHNVELTLHPEVPATIKIHVVK